MKLPSNICLTIDDPLFVFCDPAIKEDLDNYDYEAMENHLLGAVEVHRNGRNKCYEIHTIAAKRGYGSIITLITAAWTGKDGLMMYALKGKVSDPAKNMWESFINGKNSSLVDHEPVESRHDEDFLNQKIISKVNVPLRKYLKNGEKAIGRDAYGENKTAIVEMGDAFLMNEMNKIYASKKLTKPARLKTLFDVVVNSR